jgi:hypothetical protein
MQMTCGANAAYDFFHNNIVFSTTTLEVVGFERYVYKNI